MRTFKLGWQHVLVYRPAFKWSLLVSGEISEIYQNVLVSAVGLSYLSISSHSTDHTGKRNQCNIMLLKTCLHFFCNLLDRKKYSVNSTVSCWFSLTSSNLSFHECLYSFLFSHLFLRKL